MRGWVGLLVLLVALSIGRGVAAQDASPRFGLPSDEWRRLCTLGGPADRDNRIAIAPQISLTTISSVLPDQGLVPFTLEQPWEPGLAYFALVGRIEDPRQIQSNRVPPGASFAPVLHPRPGQSGQTTDIRIRLPPVDTFALWPLYRVVVMVCRPNMGAVQAAAVFDVPIAAHGTAVVGAIALVAIVILAAAAIRRRMSPGLSFARSLDPLVIAQDCLGYGSISRLQVLFFSLIVFGMLTYIALRTGVVAAISNDILFLMGIAAAGTAGAAMVGNTGPAGTRTADGGEEKKEQGSAALTPETRRFLAETGLVPADRVAQWRDLLIARGEIDIFRVQAVVFSLFVGGTLLSSGFEQLAAYEIPGTVLGLLGLSQLSYVGGKLVFRKPGEIAEVDQAAAAAETSLAAIRAGDRSPEAIAAARRTLSQLRRSLALLLEEAVPQARLDALIAQAARAKVPEA